MCQKVIGLGYLFGQFSVFLLFLFDTVSTVLRSLLGPPTPLYVYFASFYFMNINLTPKKKKKKQMAYITIILDVECP
jgi:hypothetical protein